MPEPTLNPGFFLPTIHSCYQPVEEYFRYRRIAGDEQDDQAATALRPLDALLIHVLVSFQPRRVQVADLAADATGGATTVLARTHPAVCRVAVLRTESAQRRRPLLDRYLRESVPATPAEAIEIDGELGAAPALTEQLSSLVVLTAGHLGTEAELTAQIDGWLTAAPHAAVIVLGLGDTGSCPTLSALAGHCGAASPRRLLLPREWAPALATSRVGVVGARANTHLEEAMLRTRQLYFDLYRWHDLVTNACWSVMEDAARPAPAADGAESAESLREALAAQEKEVEALRETLDELSDSVAFKLAGRARRTLKLVAPEGSHRRWWVQKLLGAVRLFRKGGLRGVAAKTVLKLTGRPAPLDSPPSGDDT
jgi:hypothetical protein